jgi:hypothetical protein
MADPQTLPEFFIEQHGAADADKRADAIRAAIATGFGTWLSPDDGNAQHRPATHLYEIGLFGVAATGQTAEQAIGNWFTVATRVLAPQVAA